MSPARRSSLGLPLFFLFVASLLLNASTGHANNLKIKASVLFSELDGSVDDEDGIVDGILTVSGKLKIKGDGEILIDLPSAEFVVGDDIKISGRGAIRDLVDEQVGSPATRIRAPSIGPTVILRSGDDIRLSGESVIDIGGSDRGGIIQLCAQEDIELKSHSRIIAIGIAQRGGVVAVEAGEELEMSGRALIDATGPTGGCVTFVSCDDGDALELGGNVLVTASGSSGSGGAVTIVARQGAVEFDDDEDSDTDSDDDQEQAIVQAAGSPDGTIRVTAGEDVSPFPPPTNPSAEVVTYSPSSEPCDCPPPPGTTVTIVIESPANGSVVNTRSPQIAVSYGDPIFGVDLDSFAATLDGQDISDLFLLFPTGAIAELMNIVELEDGAHTVEAIISNSFGVPAMEPANSTFIVSVAGSETRLKGILLDAFAETPVVNARLVIKSSGQTAFSQIDGSFEFVDPAVGEQLLLVRGSEADTSASGQTYADYSRPLEIVQGQILQISDPIFLPPIDLTGSVLIDSTMVNPDGSLMQDCIVDNSNIEVMLTLPAGTTVTFGDGSNFGSVVSVTEVPKGNAPAQLPVTVDPAILITIQPSGMSFDQPSQISFPNRDDWGAENEADLLSFDHDLGEFVNLTLEFPDEIGPLQVGAGGVSGNGPTSGGWHCPCPPQNDGGNDNDDQPGCDRAFNPRVDLYRGTYQETITLPGYRSLEEDRGVVLEYRSSAGNPEPYLASTITIPRRAALPLATQLSLTVAGALASTPVLYDTSELSESVDETFRGATLFDASDFPTDRYKYTLISTNIYASSRSRSLRQGFIDVVNRASSPFGAGWSMKGHSHLKARPNGSVLLIESTETMELFEPAPFDLNDWTQQGAPGSGNWNVSADGATVLQTINGDPTFFVSPFNFIDTAIRGKFKVETTGDDDFIGFVFGYASPLAEEGDANNDFEFLLFDWKQANQSGALEGFALSRVTGPITDFNPGFWRHTNSQNFEVLDTQYGSDQGWLDNVEYEFTLLYERDRIRIRIDNFDVFDVPGDFAPGRFGFYNYSQAQVRYESFVSSNQFDTAVGEPALTLRREDDNSFTLGRPNGSIERYTQSGLLMASTDRNGNATDYEYDSESRLIEMTDPVGLVTSFVYGSDGLLERIEDPSLRSTSFMHGPTGDLLTVTLPDGSTSQYGYDDEHRMTGITDALGNTTTLTLHEVGGVITGVVYADAVVETIRAGKPSAALLTDVIEFVECTVIIPPEGSNPRIEVTVPDCPKRTMLREPRAVSELTDGAGNVTTLRFGSDGLESETDGLGRVWSYGYDSAGNLASTVQPNGRLDVREYDERRNLVSLSEGVGSGLERQSRWERNEFGQITSYVDPGGNVTTNEYDTNGNLISTTDPLGGVRHRTYLAGTGLLATLTNENGHVTSFEYDANKRLQTVTYADGSVTAFIRDSRGNPIAMTEGVGSLESRTRQFTYDELDRTVTARDGAGNLTTFLYDGNGNLLETINPEGEVLSRVYDARNRVVTISDPISGIVSFVYDARGSIVKDTNAVGAETQFERDAAGQLVSIIDALLGMETFEYDAMGNVTVFTDANGNRTTSTYDILGRRVARCNALGECRSFTYDLVDNVVVETAPDGSEIRSLYDSRPRLVQVVTDDDQVDYSYDPVGNLLEVQDTDSSIEFTYDDRNRVETASSSPIQARDELSPIQPPVALTYSYDAVGNRIAMEDSEGGTLRYGYDDTGRLISIETPASDRIDQTYDAAGRVTSIAWPNGIVGEFDYQVATGRLERVAYGSGPQTLFESTYRYDNVGNVVEIVGMSGTRNYMYDALQRVLNGGTAASPEFYTYDAVGNITSSHLTSSYTYDQGNRLIGFADRILAYDANGRRISDVNGGTGEEITYLWSGIGRLREVQVDGTPVARYQYDGLGRKVCDELPVAVGYVFDRDDPVQQWQSGVLDQRLVYGERTDDLRAVYGIESEFVHLDRLQSTAIVTDAQASVVTEHEYSSFGVLTGATTDEEHVKYAGRPRSAQTGLFDFRARWYDATMGRFLSEDPLSHRSSSIANVYAYVRNNPVNHRDPSGLYGTNECDYYEQRCEEVGGDYYCEEAPSWCDWFPKNPDPLPHEPNDNEGWTRCVRKCLQDCDREETEDRPPRCVEEEGPDPDTDDFWTDWIPVKCHVKCYTWCAAWEVGDLIVPPAY